MQNIALNIINLCGGYKAVAGFAGVDVSRVYRWTYPKKRGGTGGRIPTKHQTEILSKALRAGISISPSDFFPAAPSSKRTKHTTDIYGVHS